MKTNVISLDFKGPFSPWHWCFLMWEMGLSSGLDWRCWWSQSWVWAVKWQPHSAERKAQPYPIPLLECQQPITGKLRANMWLEPSHNCYYLGKQIQVPVYASTLFSHSFFLSAIHSVSFSWISMFYKISVLTHGWQIHLFWIWIQYVKAGMYFECVYLI